MRTLVRFALAVALVVGLGGQFQITLPVATQFEPDQIQSDIIVWLRSTDGVNTTGASVVSSWEDKGPNSYDVNTDGGCAGPALVQDLQNGYPGLRFDGVNDCLENAVSGSHTQPFTQYLVMNTVTWTANDYIILVGANSYNRHHTSTPEVRVGGSSANVCSVSPTIGTWFLHRTMRNGASTIAQLDDDTATSTCDPGGTAAVDDLHIASAANDTSPANVEFAEILIVDGDIATDFPADHAAIVNYFQQRYQLTGLK
tara:strand:+ start:1433 stop:2200 length:768 start_codon:yes stop_codon:yes gene_type:complete